jgi:hypothetical protein
MDHIVPFDCNTRIKAENLLFLIGRPILCQALGFVLTDGVARWMKTAGVLLVGTGGVLLGSQPSHEGGNSQDRNR